MAQANRRELNELQSDLTGDVKSWRQPKRSTVCGSVVVGSYRVLFRLEGNQISVYAMRDRKDAYE
jgi:hypothetical protein